LDAFIRTAREFHGSVERLVEYGETAADLAREGLLRFGADEVTQYVARMKEAGFPAVHHSPAFEAEYRPAYRVVARHELPPEIIAAA
jgi:NADPH-dependent glutamate synthase beta subunit-like oxidoreductase